MIKNPGTCDRVFNLQRGFLSLSLSQSWICDLVTKEAHDSNLNMWVKSTSDFIIPQSLQINMFRPPFMAIFREVFSQMIYYKDNPTNVKI